MIGFDLIGEMGKDALIEEILAHQKVILEGMELAQIKATVIDIRVSAVRTRLTEEAGITVTPGIFGAQIEEKDGD